MTTGPAGESAGADASTTQVLPRDLVPAIARHLQEAGEYRVALDPRFPQRLVDLRWAALGAGRALGRRVQVAMTRTVDAGDAPITVRVTFAPAQRPTIPRQLASGDVSER